MLRGPFLTDIDSRAAVKGSRDPLGQVPIWTRLGRHVVGNLSTVSTSVRDFTVLLTGLWLIERVIEDGGAQNEVDIFMRWEQLAGYARARHKGLSFRGVEKARANLETERVTISADLKFQILGNQKIYGIWGLYSVPSASSALVEGAPIHLRPEARAFVERTYISALSKAGYRDAGAFRKLVAAPQSTLHPKGKDEKLLAALAKVLRPDGLTVSEQAFYDEHLVRGGPQDSTRGKQARLAALFQKTFSEQDYAFSGTSVVELAKMSKDREEPDSLGWRLDRIRDCEAVMAPAYRLFLFLLSRENRSIESVASEVRKTWGERIKAVNVERFQALLPELRLSVGDEAGSLRWVAIASALGAGDYAEAIREVIAHNAFVMKQRGSGAPWVELQGGKLRVRFRDDLAGLPDATAMKSLWRFPYFLDSLRLVTGQVRGVA